MSTQRDKNRDLASTTVYIYSELMDSPSFFQHVDKATDLAEKFIEKYPTGTDWEQSDLTWEEALYKFYKENTL